jgi:tellurite methyltransferase
MKEHYNKIYAENEVTFGGGKPEQIVVDILKYRHDGTVFELGAGEGRNSLYLASKGFDVTAVDLSEIGIEKIRKAAENQNISLKTEVLDIRAHEIEGTFDIFVSTFVLHHLLRDEALRVLQMMQEHTSSNGLNVISIFTKEGEFFKDNPETNNFYANLEELRKFYEDWEILEYSEEVGKAFAKRPDGTQKENVSARIVARKSL